MNTLSNTNPVDVTQETKEQELMRLKQSQPKLQTENIPEEIKKLPQWILWRYEIVTKKNGDKDVSKPPKWLDGDLVALSKTTDKSTWKTFEQCLYDIEKANKKMTPEYKIDGVGFVFVAGSGYVGIDLDECISPDGSIKQWALEIILSMPQTYWEYSPSGTGVKGIIKGTKKTDKCSRHYHDGKVEIFEKERYFTITSNRMPQAPCFCGEYQAELEALCDKVFSGDKPTPTPTPSDMFTGANTTPPQKHTVDIPSGISSTGKVEGWDIVQSRKLSDQELIALAVKSKNGDRFQSLWNGNTHGYVGKGGMADHSAADMALMNMLAFWTGKDKNRMVSMFMNSKLYRPGDKADGYVERTADRAVSDTRQTFDGISNSIMSTSDIVDGGTGFVEIKNMKVPNCLGRNDQGNAQRLAFYYGSDLRYIDNYGWIVWNGKIWERQHLKAVAMAQSVSQRIHLERDACTRLSGGSESGADNSILQWASASKNQAKVESMLAAARSMAPFTLDIKSLDVDPYLLSVDNGTLNLQTGELQPHRREDYITCISPVVYDPNAKCPQFEKFVGRMFNDNKPLIDYVLDMLGYCLTGDTNIQRFWVLWGSGANGKSTLLNAMQYIMGEYFLTASSNLMVGDNREHQTIQASLKGKRLVVCQETEAGESFKAQLLKKLTGDKTITARFLYQDFFEFQRTNKLVLVTNNMPKLTDNGASMARRLKLIPCIVEIPLSEQNESLSDILQTESSGILNLLLNGCRRALTSKLKVEPEEVTSVTETYRRDNDPVYNYLVEKTIKDPKAWVSSEAIYGSYKWYAESLGEDPVDGPTFYRCLSRQGYNPERRHTRGWLGLKINPAVGNNEFSFQPTQAVEPLPAQRPEKVTEIPQNDIPARISEEGDEDSPFR